ncbi:MAG: cache domain-containing protein [Phycisphaerales bacterium]|nr:MAG: cache domain-containing protein [Phycisphaerales bacterium]
MKTSLKAKLITGFLVVILICGLVATFVGTRLIGKGIIRQAQDKVRNDLNSAREIYRQESKALRETIRLTSLRFFIKDGLLNNDLMTLTQELQSIRKAESFDILTLTDNSGRVLVRSRNPSITGDSQAEDDLVSRVLSTGDVVAATVIVPEEGLRKEGADLVEQARIEFIPTPRAKLTQETSQTSGMMMKAASPIHGYDGELLGVLYAGNLLNRNYKIVDKVKDTVYQAVKYEGKDIGTATIFQGDLRISTNVRRQDGTRAIGTRVSEQVYDHVLVKGLPWIDRAFVVNNWYIAAYEPIRDIKDQIVGILYVGILEEKFIDMRNEATAMFLGITCAGMIIALTISSFLAKGILQPIKELIFASHEWAHGNLDYRVETTQTDEIAELTDTFNLMASSLKERDERLKEYAQQQIMKSERLATLGQLAAGVAHEINNPLGAILMYSHLSLEEMETKDPRRKNLEKVVGEATRCKDIVHGLLDFARQSEPKAEEADANEILKRTLSLIQNQASFQNIRVTTIFSPSLPKVMMDTGQIQQVFTNIILNAAEAIDGQGEVTVATRTADGGEFIEIEFTDTGCGIPQENLDKIFDPFFTTKEVGRGTGLGLAVSYGIIAKHQGTIEVKSSQGKGTTFVVRLPLKAEV